MRKINLSLALFAPIVLGIISCGGGGGGENNTANNNTIGSAANSQTIKGRAIDGPLGGAKVCLDKNLNGKCDAEEPYTYTDNQGYFQLTVKSQDTNKYPILVEVNQDTQGNEAGGNYILASPPGAYQVISPLTSMVFAEMIKNNIGLDDAKKDLESALSNKNPFTDYIKAGDSDLKNIAVGTSKVLSNILSELSTDSNYATFVQNNQLEVVTAILDEAKNYILDLKIGNINLVEKQLKEKKDEILTLARVLKTLKNKESVNNILETFNNTFELSTTDGTHLSQRIVKYQRYKAKLKNIDPESDLANEIIEKYYDIDKLYGGYINKNGTLLVYYDNYTWYVLNASKVNLKGKSINGCLLFNDDFDRISAMKYMSDLCQKITFEEQGNVYIFSIKLKPILANDTQSLLKLAKSINEHNYDWMSVYTTFSEMINNQIYGSTNTFSLDGFHSLQFKAANLDSDIEKGNIILANNGADVGDYWTITNNETEEKFLIINTVFGSAIGREWKGKVLFKYFYTKPEIHTFLSLDEKALNKFLSAIKPQLKPLPEEATFPIVGYQKASNVFGSLFNGNTEKVIGKFQGGYQSNWINCSGTICSQNCTVNYSNNTLSIDCGNGNSASWEVYPYNRDYSTIIIRQDSNPENRLTNVLDYLDSDTACFEAGYFNRAENYFCITSAETPSKETLSQMIQDGYNYAFFDSEGAWKLRYCIHFEDNGNGALEFKAYDYSTGKVLKGTVTIDNGILKLTELSNNTELISKVVKANSEKGIIVGFSASNNNFADNYIKLMVKTTSCPSF